MDSLETYRQIIERVLLAHATIPYAYGQIETQAVFDRAAEQYVLLILGWEGLRRVHGCLAHLAIIDGKIWIQRDGTEHGLAVELMQAGIPKTAIVLAFHPPEIRQHTDFATA